MAVTLDSLKKTIKKNKGRSQALAWLADMELATGEFESALSHVDAALAASPSDVPAMLVRAKILAIQQDFAGCISEYKKVLAKDPFCLSAHKKMGEKGGMKVTHVNEIVQEVFEVTGFADILNIE
jgi:Predicted N-acetylglucosaminyl transferase